MTPTAEMLVESRATLQRHPDDPVGPVSSIEASVRRTAGGLLALTYRISGDLDHVRIPTPASPRLAERLWQHTCCEVFLRVQGAEPYHELNFSPSGEWAAYAFERYRAGGLLEDDTLDPKVQLRALGGVLELRASIALERLSRSYADAPLALGLSTVTEARDGARSYWALAHPAEKPDFHDPGAFALTLDAIRH
jgi:hypothetical protein